jgi:predicted metalloprotease
MAYHHPNDNDVCITFTELYSNNMVYYPNDNNTYMTKEKMYKLINERIEKLEEHIKKLEEKLNDPDHYYKLIAIIKIQRWWRYIKNMKEAKKQWNKHLLVANSL